MDKSSLLWIFLIVACTVGSSDGAKRGRVWKDVLSARGNDPGVLDTGDGDGELGLIGSFVKTRKRDDGPAPQKPLPDCVESQVCSEWHEFEDSRKSKNEQYCNCTNNRVPACGENWEENNAVLTFRTFLRSDWAYQYQFCTTYFGNKRDCVGNETAAILKELFGTTKTILERVVCRCPTGNLYEFVSWKNFNGYRLNYYSCEKPYCASVNTTCAEEEKTSLQNGGKFKYIQGKYKCNCWSGKKCLTKDPVSQQGDIFYYKCIPVRRRG